MTVSLEDTSGSQLISADQLTELTDLTAFLYARLGLGPDVELAVTLVDETQIAQLHLDWMDRPGATDVLSFPMDLLVPGTPENPVRTGVLGDIVLCPAVAQAQAAAAGHALGDELCLLTTHGVLHLLGYDHDDDASRADMFGLQQQLLEAFLGREAPVPTETGSTAADASDQRSDREAASSQQVKQ